MSARSDAAARAHAVDPARNVVLEASAGTGKTSVLVERYVNLLRAGVEPDHILAITFTRKAAAEMRERIVARLREAARLSQLDAGRWRELRERLGDIAIATIDAFCLSLLREFPLESDVDPGFDLADDTEAPRLIAEALDQSLRICRGLARSDDDVALLFAQLGERRLRTGLAALLDRRLVAPQALRRYLSSGPRDLNAAEVCRRAAGRLRDVFAGVAGGVERFLADGPRGQLSFAMLADDIRTLCTGTVVPAFERREDQAEFRVLVDRLRAYFVKADGSPREGSFSGTGFTGADCASDAVWKRHRAAAASIAPAVGQAVQGFRRDLNVVLSRAVWRVFGVTVSEYQRTLDSRALLDFSGVLERAVKLLADMDEFAQSRFKLEARYRHVLVDEFQDTSRAQWQLVAQLVRNWGEGFGAASDALQPSIFIVGDRKQSIYGFRDAEVTVLDDAAAFVTALRERDDPRHAISVSFRSTRQILAFVNDLFTDMHKAPDRPDRFRYDETDRFPLEEFAEGAERGVTVRLKPDATTESSGSDNHQTTLPWDSPSEDEEDISSSADSSEPSLGLVVAGNITEAAEGVASEVSAVIGTATVRDRATGVRRAARASDIAVLFRSRDTHREYEKALERHGIPTYVYKGLGFFDADEVQDAVALLRFLADPHSNLRAAALLRSRVVRLSDRGVAMLAPRLAAALTDVEPPETAKQLSAEDTHVFMQLRSALPEWRALVDRVTPSELLSRLLRETSLSYELHGPRYRQSRENLKKLRAMIRRFQNRGYATLARVVDHIDQLALGDESNATIDAHDAVSLMTVHAAKGLEFPIVFIVDLSRGTGSARAPIRVVADIKGESSVAVADYQSEADEDAVARDREETKRLLYVAVTRARDRLYLSGVAVDGVFKPTRGALGGVLPDSMRAVFGSAAAAGPRLTWTSSSRHEHEFVVQRSSQLIERSAEAEMDP
jgi:ATP-dependent helicase/nuclease subunit A